MFRNFLKSAILIALTALLSSSAFAESRLQSILANGELRVGTTGDWNPMTFIDPDSKERKGFDIDIATALAADMGIKVVFVPTTWKTLVTGVVSNKYDMTSSASLSPKRALVAGYSSSYFAVEDVPSLTFLHYRRHRHLPQEIMRSNAYRSESRPFLLFEVGFVRLGLSFPRIGVAILVLLVSTIQLYHCCCCTAETRGTDLLFLNYFVCS